MNNPIRSLAMGCAIVLCAGPLLAENLNPKDPVQEEHTQWVAKCWEDFRTIKPGMTRAEVEKRFPKDGGFMTFFNIRFVHPECAMFKVEVEFELKRNENDQGRADPTPDDKVIKVSKPYIEPGCG